MTDKFYDNNKNNIHFNPATSSEDCLDNLFSGKVSGINNATELEFSDELFPEAPSLNQNSKSHSNPHSDRI